MSLPRAQIGLAAGIIVVFIVYIMYPSELSGWSVESLSTPVPPVPVPKPAPPVNSRTCDNVCADMVKAESKRCTSEMQKMEKNCRAAPVGRGEPAAGVSSGISIHPPPYGITPWSTAVHPPVAFPAILGEDRLIVPAVAAAMGTHTVQSSDGLSHLHMLQHTVPSRNFSAIDGGVRSTNAFAYLNVAPRGPHMHKDYFGLIRESISMLEKHVMKPYGYCDIIIFFEDPTTTNVETQYSTLVSLFPLINFRFIPAVGYYHTPNPVWRWRGRTSAGQSCLALTWPIGYLHMCRFFARNVFRFRALMEYAYVWRVDTDLYFKQQPLCDVWQYMERAHAAIGFVTKDIDPPGCSAGAYESVALWAEINRVVPHNLDAIKRGTTFYGNFGVYDMRFWRRGDVIAISDYMVKIGGIYAHRWGDQVIFPLVVATLGDAASALMLTAAPYFHHRRQGDVLSPDPACPVTVKLHELALERGLPSVNGSLVNCDGTFTCLHNMQLTKSGKWKEQGPPIKRLEKAEVDDVISANKETVRSYARKTPVGPPPADEPTQFDLPKPTVGAAVWIITPSDFGGANRRAADVAAVDTDDADWGADDGDVAGGGRGGDVRAAADDHGLVGGDANGTAPMQRHTTMYIDGMEVDAAGAQVHNTLYRRFGRSAIAAGAAADADGSPPLIASPPSLTAAVEIAVSDAYQAVLEQHAAYMRTPTAPYGRSTAGAVVYLARSSDELKAAAQHIAAGRVASACGGNGNVHHIVFVLRSMMPDAKLALASGILGRAVKQEELPIASIATPVRAKGPARTAGAAAAAPVALPPVVMVPLDSFDVHISLAHLPASRRVDVTSGSCADVTPQSAAVERFWSLTLYETAITEHYPALLLWRDLSVEFATKPTRSAVCCPLAGVARHTEIPFATSSSYMPKHTPEKVQPCLSLFTRLVLQYLNLNGVKDAHGNMANAIFPHDSAWIVTSPGVLRGERYLEFANMVAISGGFQNAGFKAVWLMATVAHAFKHKADAFPPIFEVNDVADRHPSRLTVALCDPAKPLKGKHCMATTCYWAER